jgi:predicted SprT family Zn-dependent metalloprotease
MKTTKTILAAAGMAVLAGCSAGRDLLDDTVREVNETAFGGEITSRVDFCSSVESRQVHGVFDPKKDEIRLAGEWIWEPSIYLKGAVAHEMIHAWQYRYGKNDKLEHDEEFQAQRTRVADLLGIPLWAIHDGSRPDKIDASRQMATLDASFDAMRYAATNGRAMGTSATSGWPTHLYK